MYTLCLAIAYSLCFQRVSATTLQDFYYDFDGNYKYNSTELCKQKWLNTTRGPYKTNPNYIFRPQAKILLVHVGKTGGGSIMDLLEKNRMDWHQVHEHAVEASMIREHSVILLSLREPVSRQISAFNWRLGKPHDRNLGNRSAFYGCFSHVNEYAQALYASSFCGTQARIGELHTELNTCSYLGGIVDELERNRQKVFALDTFSFVSDLNKISAHLKWGKHFVNPPHTHRSKKDGNSSYLSPKGQMQLEGFVEMLGEAPLYRTLMKMFRLP